MTEPRNNGFGRACGASLAGIVALLLSAAPCWAGLCGIPAPLIGVTGPYGLLAAGVAYGGYHLFTRLKNRG
jgi:hypothetical protein